METFKIKFFAYSNYYFFPIETFQLLFLSNWDVQDEIFHPLSTYRIINRKKKKSPSLFLSSPLLCPLVIGKNSFMVCTWEAFKHLRILWFIELSILCEIHTIITHAQLVFVQKEKEKKKKNTNPTELEITAQTKKIPNIPTSHPSFADAAKHKIVYST